MRKTQGLIEMVVGLSGTAAILCLGEYWTFLPLIVYGIISIVLLRRIATEQVSKEEENCVRKRNVTTLICWAVIAVICYLTFHGTRIAEGGGWFLLSAYMFLLIHGIAFLAPANSFPNEKK